MTVTLRAARPTDAGATGTILRQGLPPAEAAQHSTAETIAFCGTMIDRGWVTVAEADGRVQGFVARDGAEICALYLAPHAQGRGLGRMLLEATKRHADRLHLRSLTGNLRARRLYTRAGFRPIAPETCAESAQNIHYVWTREAAA